MRDRVLHVNASNVAVTFQDLVIRNGNAADDGTSGASTNPTAQNGNRAGGGILNNGGSVTLTNVAVQSCRALGKGDLVVDEHLTLDAHGGGLASLGATGNVVVTGSTLSDNLANGGDAGDFNNGSGSNARGGAIYFEGGTLNIDGSRIEASAANGGDGNTINDIVIAADCKSVKLCAEREGGGNGRVYTITFEVTDASGNVGTATATVTVPHAQNGAAAADDGPQYTVMGGCP